MRGKPTIQQSCINNYRITPAHAGKTPDCNRSDTANQDHPRACGENLLPHLQLYNTTGSPPRMRGKRGLLLGMVVGRRITPAHAGKTQPGKMSQSGQPDHPRACGENAVPQPVYTIKPGSPPRMRGKPPLRITYPRYSGITPAHAGKTCLEVSDMDCKEDHPRACGENVKRKKIIVNKMGSPPRMRGKL